MGFLKFLEKKKDVQEMRAEDVNVPPPHPPEAVELYSDLPTFPSSAEDNEQLESPAFENIDMSNTIIPIEGIKNPRQFRSIPKKEPARIEIPPPEPIFDELQPVAEEKMTLPEKVEAVKQKYDSKKPFIHATEFTAMNDNISRLRKATAQFSGIISELDKLDAKREGKFSEWKGDLEFMQKKLFNVDEILFKGD